LGAGIKVHPSFSATGPLLTESYCLAEFVAEQEDSISYHSDLEDERKGVLGWLFDVAFGRRVDDDDGAGGKIHRLGTINRLLEEDDD
jgi:hypothetical protein